MELTYQKLFSHTVRMTPTYIQSWNRPLAALRGRGRHHRLLTRHTYWLWGPGEKVLERMMVFPRRNGPGEGAATRRSLGRTTVGDGATLSVLVSLSTCGRTQVLYQCPPSLRALSWSAWQLPLLLFHFWPHAQIYFLGSHHAGLISWAYQNGNGGQSAHSHSWGDMAVLRFKRAAQPSSGPKHQLHPRPPWP